MTAGSDWETALAELTSRSAASTALPDAVREIGLALSFSGRGMVEEARHHGAAAVKAGLDREQVVEALLTGLLHGGRGIFSLNRWLLDVAPEPAAPRAGSAREDDVDVDVSTVVAYFEDVWGGSLPAWLQAVADADPALLLAYHDVRTVALGEGALPKRHKELLIAMMSCVEHYDFGIEVHLRNALACGASEAEVLDTVRASQVAGGIVAWVSGFEIASRVLAEAADTSAS